MSISVTEILGTDSIASSRIVINNNFNVVTNEINQIENYLDPSSGILDGLSSLTTNALTVGSTGSYLSVSSTAFTMTSDVTVNGNMDVVGHVYTNNIYATTISEDTMGASSADIGTISSAPAKSIYRVGNSASSPTGSFTLNLWAGEIGQEITFVYESGYTGTVSIVEAGSVPIVLGSGNTQIDLDAVGDTVKLICITNSVGNKEWYVTGGNGYVIS